MTAAADACDALCRVLRVGNDVERCLAAQALGSIGDARAVDALVACLMDEDPDVRIDAVDALGLLGDRRAGAALADSLLGDPCNDVKTGAVEALGRLGHDKAVPVLRRLVRGRDETIAWDDADLLNGGWDDWLDIQIRAIEALGRLGAVEAAPDIAEAIGDDMGQDVTGAGMKALARLGAPGIEMLVRFLGAPDGRQRRGAARVLAGLDSDAARRALGRAVSDPSPDVRIAAARGLAAWDAADPRLAALFGDANAEVRAEAARLCGDRHPGRLDALLDDPGERVQAVAVGVFAAVPRRARPRDLTRRLRIKLRGPSAEVAVAAASALAAVAPDVAFDDLAERLNESHSPPAVRCTAARALAAMGTDRAAHVLAQAIGDDQRRVRLDAIAGLGRMAAGGDSDLALQALLLALGRERAAPPAEEPAVKAAADGETEKGGESGSGADWPASTLAAILGEDADATAAVGRADGVELTAEDIEYLALASRSPTKRRVSPDPEIPAHNDVPRFAARVLGDVARDEVARGLALALTESDAGLRRAAAGSLARVAGRMGGLPADVVEDLIDGCKDPDREIRHSLARALGHAGAPAAVPALRGMLGDCDSFVRAEAARSLGALGAAGAPVEALLADDDPGVRHAAAEAVAAQGGAGAVGTLVDFAFAFHGFHRRHAACLLRRLDREAAGARFIETLGDPARRRAWRVAIEALEELHRRDPAPMARPRNGGLVAA